MKVIEIKKQKNTGALGQKKHQIKIKSVFLLKEKAKIRLLVLKTILLRFTKSRRQNQCWKTLFR